jgi:hypothetical protein
MVAQNVMARKRIRKRRQDHQAHVKVLAQAGQATLNKLLWQIIMENAAAQADPDVDTDGKEIEGILIAPTEELDKVPDGSAIDVSFNAEEKTLTFRAYVQKPKSNIVLPDGSSL